MFNHINRKLHTWVALICILKEFLLNFAFGIMPELAVMLQIGLSMKPWNNGKTEQNLLLSLWYLLRLWRCYLSISHCVLFQVSEMLYFRSIVFCFVFVGFFRPKEHYVIFKRSFSFLALDARMFRAQNCSSVLIDRQAAL